MEPGRGADAAAALPVGADPNFEEDQVAWAARPNQSDSLPLRIPIPVKGMSQSLPKQGPPPPSQQRTFTCNEAVEAVGFGRFQLMVILICGLCWMADGMEMVLVGFISPAVLCEFGITDVELTLLTSAVFVGLMIGSIVWGVVADSYGRRMGFFATSVFCLVFGLGSAFAPSFYWLVVMRFGVGIGVGGVPIAFSLNQEFLPTAYRGPVGMMLSMFWSVGALFEAGLAWGVMPAEWGIGVDVEPWPTSWRWLTAISAAPLGLLFLLCPFVPESPQFLCAQGRLAEAEAVLRRAASWNGTTLPAGRLVGSDGEAGDRVLVHVAGGGSRVRGSMTKLKTAAKQKIAKRRQGSPGELLRGQLLCRITLPLFVVWFAAAFMYYGQVLITTNMFAAEEAGERCPEYNIDPGDPTDPDACAELGPDDYADVFITTFGEVPGLILTILLMQALGRRYVLSAEAGLAAVFLVALWPCPGRTEEVVFLFIIRGVATGLFQALYVFTAEIFPPATRATMIGACSAVARVGGIATPYVAQVLSNKSWFLAFGSYAVVALLASLAVLLIPIETSGKPAPVDVEELSEWVADAAGDDGCECCYARKDRSGYEVVGSA